MKMVEIPFMERFREPMLSGAKTCTSRTRRMAKPGDTFAAFGQSFQVNQVWGTSLGIVEKTLWKREGVGSPDEFRLVWAQIHPIKGFQEWRLVYVHEFSRCDPAHPYPERPCRDCRKPFVPTIVATQFQCVDCIERTTPHDEGDEELD